MMKMKIENKEQYEKLIENKVNLILRDFKKVIENKKNKEIQKNTFLLNLRNRYVDLESDKKFTGIFTEIRNIDENLEEGQPYFLAIEKYIESGKRNRNEIMNYLIEYYATVKAHNLISEYSVEKQK